MLVIWAPAACLRCAVSAVATVIYTMRACHKYYANNCFCLKMVSSAITTYYIACTKAYGCSVLLRMCVCVCVCVHMCLIISMLRLEAAQQPRVINLRLFRVILQAIAHYSSCTHTHAQTLGSEQNLNSLNIFSTVYGLLEQLLRFTGWWP